MNKTIATILLMTLVTMGACSSDKCDIPHAKSAAEKALEIEACELRALETAADVWGPRGPDSESKEYEYILLVMLNVCKPGWDKY